MVFIQAGNEGLGPAYNLLTQVLAVMSPGMNALFLCFDVYPFAECLQFAVMEKAVVQLPEYYVVITVKSYGNVAVVSCQPSENPLVNRRIHVGKLGVYEMYDVETFEFRQL